MQRYYKGENIINCRDLGGYACDGGTTKYGVALRAGVMRDPDEKDLANLQKFGIRTVIDLRGIEEAADMPSYFKNNDGYNYYHFPLLEANPAMAKSDAPMTELYKDCLWYKIYVGGTWGKRTRMGTPLSRLVDEDEVMPILEKTLLWFKENANSKERLGLAIDRVGIENLEQAVFTNDIIDRKNEILAK